MLTNQTINMMISIHIFSIPQKYLFVFCWSELMEATYDEIVRVEARPTRPGIEYLYCGIFVISLSESLGAPSEPGARSKCLTFLALSSALAVNATGFCAHLLCTLICSSKPMSRVQKSNLLMCQVG